MATKAKKTTMQVFSTIPDGDLRRRWMSALAHRDAETDRQVKRLLDTPVSKGGLKYLHASEISRYQFDGQ